MPPTDKPLTEKPELDRVVHEIENVLLNGTDDDVESLLDVLGRLTNPSERHRLATWAYAHREKKSEAPAPGKGAKVR